ncbi:MAG TPA: hypothetical protein VEH50_10860 [Methylomirabilota bacterium]|nr:hypothetical protein [Methylomirabilota bacterium]
MFQIFSRAFFDSLRALGTAPKAIGLSVLGAVVTAGVVLLARGREQLKKHLVENILIVFAGALGTWLLVFVVVLVRLPAKMLRESDANLAKVIVEKQQLSIANDALNAELRGEKQELEAKDSQARNLEEQLKNATSVAKRGLVKDQFASLDFGFYPSSGNELSTSSEEPALLTNGVVSIDLGVRGASSITAINGSFWIIICQGCKYASEPSGFVTVPGLDEHSRLMNFDRIFPHILIQKMTVVITPPPGVTRFDIAFKYACQNCAPDPPVQYVKVHVIP